MRFLGGNMIPLAPPPQSAPSPGPAAMPCIHKRRPGSGTGHPLFTLS